MIAHASARRRSWARDPTVLWRDSGGGVLLLGPADDAPLLLSPVAAVVWHALGSARDTRAVVAEVAAAFGVPAPHVEADVARLLDVLHARKLVVAVPEA